MKTQIFLLVILLTVPIASAYDQILNVQDEQTYGPQTFFDQTGTRTYQFSLNNNFFNLSGNDIDNNTVWQSTIRAQIKEEGEISTTNTYTIQINFNNTWAIFYHVAYIRHDWGRWERIYDFILAENGVSTQETQCRTDRVAFPHLGGTTPPPNIWINFDISLHGRFGSNPSLYVNFGDEQQGDMTCNLPGSIGGGIQFPVTRIDGVPSVTITTYDAELYDDVITYTFDTKQNEIAEQENFNANVSAQGCEQTFIIFGLCNLFNGLIAGIDFIFGGISWVTEKILGKIPFVGIIFEYIGIIFTNVGQTLTTFLNLYFLTNNQFGLGEIFWFHVIYTASWGALIAAFTGNLLYIITIPGWFVWYSGKLLYHFFKFFFWTVPNKAIELIAALIPG